MKLSSFSNRLLMARLIRVRDAPAYLGMDRNKFNSIVRPFLTEISLGTQAIAFDRLEIDAWVEDYISRNGCRPKASTPLVGKLEDDICQNATKCQNSALKAVSGKLKKDVKMQKAAGSVRARKRLLALKQKKS